MLITVDGLAGSGKGTLARVLGKTYNLPVLDTGALWRVLALHLLAEQYHSDIETDALNTAAHRLLDRGLDLTLVESPDLRSETTGQMASIVSGFSQLRRRLDYFQKDWVVSNNGRGVLDGRETGISIAPQADHKFFLFAEVAARAVRRSIQLNDSNVAAIAASIATRDQREITRSVCPVRPAVGAVIIDTTLSSIRCVQEIALNAIQASLNWDVYRAGAFQL